MCFPNIDYQVPVPILGNHQGLPSGPRGMVTLLTNRNLLHFGEMDAINNMEELEADIIQRIAVFQVGDNPLDVFHRIQIWGGLTGRSIYTRDGGFLAESVLPYYNNLLITCLGINELNQLAIHEVFNAIHVFNVNVRNIGISFITKHTRFWLTRSLGGNALPIYDNVMAQNLMGRRNATETNLLLYWQRMINKAQYEDITLVALERILFHYYQNL